MEIVYGHDTEKNTSDSISIIRHSRDGGTFTEEKCLSFEHILNIYVNEQQLFKVVCSPDMLAELVVGRLLTEGIAGDKEQLERVYLCDSLHTARVFLKENVTFDKKDVYSVSTCCTDNITFVKEQVEDKHIKSIIYSEEDIYSLSDAMEGLMPLYEKTRAVHSAFLSYNGNIICSSEDIGRHNAVDKVIGKAIIEGVDITQCILYSSGRMPVDMVRKAIRAGVPVFAAKGAPTIQSVELAQKNNLTLIANARKDGYNVYC